jgi:hypothetical protein
MTQKKIHSVDYIRAIKEYLKLRTEMDDLTQPQQIHLAYLAFLIKANGTSSVGYAELRRLRLARTTISNNIKKFKTIGIISKVDVGHANQYNKKGVVSRFYFDLDALLALNAKSAESSLAGRSKDEVLSPLGQSAESSQESAESSQGSEPVLSGWTLPERAFLNNTNPKQSLPEEATAKSFVVREGTDSTTTNESEGNGVEGECPECGDPCPAGRTCGDCTRRREEFGFHTPHLCPDCGVTRGWSKWSMRNVPGEPKKRRCPECDGVVNPVEVKLVAGGAR